MTLSEENVLFSNFDKKFQEKIVQALLLDRQWASQFCDVVKPEFFSTAYLQKLVDKYLAYHSKYKDFPSLNLMIDIMKEEMKTGIDVVLRDQIIDCIKRIASSQDLGDLAYVKEKALEYCRRMALKKALTESVGLVEQANYESIVGVIKKAISLGNGDSPAMDLCEDIEARYKENARKTVETGVKELDSRDCLMGGLGAGELGIVMAGSKIGKCFSKNTKIIMHDGTLKNVQDVVSGDKVMGPDSKERNVLEAHSGFGKMFKITPSRGGKEYIVNEEHILFFKRMSHIKGKNKNIEMSVKKYIEKYGKINKDNRLVRTSIEFDKSIQKELIIPPYILGLLIGDGYLNKNRIEVTTADEEIKNELVNYAMTIGMGISEHFKKENKAVGYYFTSYGKHNSVLRNKLELLKLLGTKSGNKFIPQEYKTASVKDRFELIAGLIDTDGNLSDKNYEYCSKSKQLAEDMAFLCRSVGLTASFSERIISGTTYYRIFLTGNIEKIPSKLKRKTYIRNSVAKNYNLSSFQIEEMPNDDNYYGFSVDGDNLFLVDDTTIFHNSHVLIQFGANALRNKKNVLHITFELREIPTGIRYDSNLTDIPSIDCYEQKTLINDFYKENKTNIGRLKIKYFSASSVTTNQLTAHMEKLSLEGFNPDLLIIDYLQLMRSTEKTDMLRLEIKKVCEELRCLADEKNVPIWSALQGNRGSYGDSEISLENSSESLGPIQTADIILGLSRRPEDKATGIGTLAVLGNRVGKDGQKFRIHLDTGRSKMKVLDDQLEVSSHDVSEQGVRKSIVAAYRKSANAISGLPFEKV